MLLVQLLQGGGPAQESCLSSLFVRFGNSVSARLGKHSFRLMPSLQKSLDLGDRIAVVRYANDYNRAVLEQPRRPGRHRSHEIGEPSSDVRLRVSCNDFDRRCVTTGEVPVSL